MASHEIKNGAFEKIKDERPGYARFRSRKRGRVRETSSMNNYFCNVTFMRIDPSLCMISSSVSYTVNVLRWLSRHIGFCQINQGGLLKASFEY